MTTWSVAHLSAGAGTKEVILIGMCKEPIDPCKSTRARRCLRTGTGNTDKRVEDF